MFSLLINFFSEIKGSRKKSLRQSLENDLMHLVEKSGATSLQFWKIVIDIDQRKAHLVPVDFKLLHNDFFTLSLKEFLENHRLDVTRRPLLTFEQAGEVINDIVRKAETVVEKQRRDYLGKNAASHEHLTLLVDREKNK